MNEPVQTALGATAGLLAVTVDQIEEVLPALGRVIADVEQDWLDAAGRVWVDRAVQLHRTLDRELDGALAAGRLVAALVERVAEQPAAGRPDGDLAGWPSPAGRWAPDADAGRGAIGAADGVPAPGDGAARPGGAVPDGGYPGAGPRSLRVGGPRLGGTDAQRVDEERGMRIAQLDGE